MKITRINLTNIGPYKGTKNIFNIDVEKNKNIILIGGKNGAGKTTLLNSIKIGLFGTYSYGLKTNTNIYYNSIKKMFNYVESRKKNSSYEIEIEFKLVENYIENTYVFQRFWNKENDNINETLKIKKNDRYLQDEDSEIIQTKLKEIMPPSVIDTMLFDGEKIAQIIDENKIADYLKEIINVNFNLNIFEKMEDDIKFYIDKENERKALDTDEINLLEYKNKYNEAVKNHKNINEILKKYSKTLEEKKFKLKNLMKKFENYGGLTDSEKFSMRSSLEILENTRKQNLASIKEFLEDDIVFYMNIDRINNIKKSLNKEKPKILLKYISEIEEYLNNGITEKVKEEILKKSGINDLKELTVKYKSTPKLDTVINKVLSRYEETPVKELKKILLGSREDLNNTKIYKKIIGNNENANSNDLQKLLKEIKMLEVEIEDLKSKIKEIEKEIKNASAEVNSSLIALDAIEKKLDTEKKEENSFFVARKILKISEQYKMKQINNYLTKIAELSVKKFEEINKKTDYITKISIDKDTYNITLYDNNNIEKDITILSAGEKQLLVSAIVWSIFKLADRNNIFTFDTPLARLDKENRALFVEKVLCTISDQVMILSTDEEIVGDLYEIVKDRISKTYELINDDKLGKTEIKEAYF